MPRRTKDAATVAENLALLDGRVTRQAEKYPAWLVELAMADATQLKEAGGQLHTLLRRFGKSFATPAPHGAHLPEHRAALIRAAGALRASFYPDYSRALCSEAGLTPADLLPMAEIGGARIAYVKNAYADEAYEDFSAILPSPTATYADSFRAACEEVVSGEADLCLLPYENAGGFLTGFATLAERYALVCVATCRVFHADGTDVTHFALYRQAFMPLRGAGVRYLRYSFPLSGEDMLAAHITAAAALGARIERLLCEGEAETAVMRCTATLALTEHTLTPWLTHLAVFVDGHTVHGLYKEI